MSVDRRRVRVRVNGELYEAEVEPRLSLADFLRGELGLTGTHVGCEHGVCGACTVLLEDEPVRSCLMLAVQADGMALTTVEGLSRDGELHPLQRAFIEERGLQCGFCTPGFLMAVEGLLRRHPRPSDEELYQVLGGQLCRCTGYERIVRSVRRAVAERAGEGGVGGGAAATAAESAAASERGANALAGVAATGSRGTGGSGNRT